MNVDGVMARINKLPAHALARFRQFAHIVAYPWSIFTKQTDTQHTYNQFILFYNLHND